MSYTLEAVATSRKLPLSVICVGEHLVSRLQKSLHLNHRPGTAELQGNTLEYRLQPDFVFNIRKGNCDEDWQPAKDQRSVLIDTTGDYSSIMADAGGVSSQQPLYAKYPISSQWEFTLKDGQSLKGEVYCTDPVADLVILQDSQNDIRMISVSSIDSASRDEANEDPTIEQKKFEAVHSKKALEEREKRAIRMAQESLKHLNPKVRRSDIFSFTRACNNIPIPFLLFSGNL